MKTLALIVTALGVGTTIALKSAPKTVAEHSIFEKTGIQLCHDSNAAIVDKGNPEYVRAYQKYQELLRGNMKNRLSNLDPLACCFAEGTSPAVIQAFHDALANVPDGAWPSNSRYNLNNSWNSSGNFGNPVTLTYSFVPDGLQISGSVGEPASPSILFSSLDSKFSAVGGRATWKNLFAAIFLRWSQLTGLTYTFVRSGSNDWDDGAAWGTGGNDTTRGDIRIASHPIDGGSGILAYNFYPQNGDMVIDSAENWASGTNNFRFFRNTLAHENGHGIGLAHVDPRNQTKLMEPFLNTGFDGPQHDDMRGAQAMYGDDFEPNNAVATAFNLGSLAIPSFMIVGTVPPDATFVSAPVPSFGSVAGLHPNGPDMDYYKFTVGGACELSVIVTPVGLTYDSNTQNGPTNTINSMNFGDLRLSVIGTNGTTVLLSRDATGAGNQEVGTLLLPTAGTYTLKVDAPSVSNTQLYKLDVGLFSAARTLSGQITLNDFTLAANAANPAQIEVTNVGSSTVLATTNATMSAAGNYSASMNLASGTYDVYAKVSHWLRKKLGSVSITAATTTGLNFTLINGDVDGNNEIGPGDFSALSNAFGSDSGSSNWNPLADLDGDGEVGPNDFSILSVSFGTSGN